MSDEPHVVTSDEVTDRLHQHLRSWVGEWPPPATGVLVIGQASRLEPTWDGTIRALQGVSNGSAAVLSVRPDAVDAVTAAVAGGLGDPSLGDRLGEILGTGPARFGTGVFRTVASSASISPDIEALGEWYERHDPELPEWLAPFNGPRLVARDETGRVIAGVGIKVHDQVGYELAVVTDEAARGRGFARRLVATAARGVLARGGVPTYLHEPSNDASARVAEAVGFVDSGWTVHGLWPTS